MTKQQWDAVRDQMRSPLGRARLKCDEFDVTVTVVPWGALRFVIVCYVGGDLRGGWLIEDCEERRRFMRKRSSYVFPARVRTEFAREFGNRALAKSGLARRWEHWEFHWTSFDALRRHLVANNERIELVEVGYGVGRVAG